MPENHHRPMQGNHRTAGLKILTGLHANAIKLKKKERFLEILYKSMMISEIKIVPLHYVSKTTLQKGLKEVT